MAKSNELVNNLFVVLSLLEGISMTDRPSTPNKPAQKPGQNSARRNNSRRRYPNKNQGSGKPNNPNQQNANSNPNQRQDNKMPLVDRIYEKYQNLLEQHLIARRKFHDLFYRADLPQKNKLERLFYSSIKEIRDFEARLNPVERELFEKRNNGLSLDLTYSSLNAEALEASSQPISLEPSDPHYMQSQKNASYSDDSEESVGCKADYEKYKMSH